ncbi:septal ring lytic transglycosylase RlpA family protein [Rhodoplanes sp. Z2-YC6860]|uniref:septal ring lytic transglycosylase RlpA family protein n=1 Tax=Rhodoplanes sp. Z2-YC6860 TaxID=674703 RepID=UPI00078BC19F|nr:septal ring lytic transglycosylase RlpA family protein [Rhodoplanes sp. Z2-YC6860]AMN42419.1 rare lipoprotein A [Rhodoplanes sp. Z2-YC6860]
MVARAGAVGCCCLALAQCGGSVSKLDPKYGVSASPRLVQLGEPVPKGGGTYRVGKPYVVGGRTYSPEENSNYRAEGIASWYGEDFHGRQTANGEIYDMQSISAAHPTLPIPSYARVTNLKNQRSIIVRINDRGPYHADRLIDVSSRTAQLLGFSDTGTTQVRVEYVGKASLAGSDDTRLEATLRRGTPAPGPNELKAATVQAFNMRSEQPPISGRVPTPSDRPFELGHDDNGARMAARAQAQNVASVERVPLAPPAAQSRQKLSFVRSANAGEATNFDSRFAPANSMPAAPNRAEPVSAYAGQGGTPRQGAVISGRGLY